MIARKRPWSTQLLLGLLLMGIVSESLPSFAQEGNINPDARDWAVAPAKGMAVVWGIDGYLAKKMIPAESILKPPTITQTSVGSVIYRIEIDLTKQTATVTNQFLTRHPDADEAGGRGLYVVPGSSSACFVQKKDSMCMLYYTIMKKGRIFVTTIKNNEIKDRPLFDAAAVCGAACDKGTFTDGIAAIAALDAFNIWLNGYRQPNKIYNFQFTAKGGGAPKWVYETTISLSKSEKGFDGLEILGNGDFVANWNDFVTPPPKDKPNSKRNLYTRYDNTGKIIGADVFIDTGNDNKYGTGIVFDKTNDVFIVSAYYSGDYKSSLLIFDAAGKFMFSVPITNKISPQTYAPCGGIIGKMCIEDLGLEPPPAQSPQPNE